MGRWREKWFEEDGSEELETEGAREEAMEINNWASQNSRFVELKKKTEQESLKTLLRNNVHVFKKIKYY
jgi:hypothetical protein